MLLADFTTVDHGKVITHQFMDGWGPISASSTNATINARPDFSAFHLGRSLQQAGESPAEIADHCV